MAKLSADEQRLMEELNARAAAPDEDDNFEIEIYDTEKNRGARIPFKRGKGWLFDTFGIGEAPASTEGGQEGGTGGPAGAGGSEGGTGAGGQGSGGHFFGRKTTP